MSVEPYLPRVIVLITHLRQPQGPSRVARIVQQVISDYQGRARIEIVETDPARLLERVRELESGQRVDIVVCSGATADYLRQHIATSVLTIHTGEFDLIRALDLAREQARSRATKIGILSFGQPHPELAAIQSLFTVAIREATYDSFEEARQQVERLASEGHHVIVGSPTVAQLADEAGSQGVLALNADSIRCTLDNALSICRSRYQESHAIQRTDRRIRNQARPRQFTARYRFEQIIGEAPAFRATMRLAQRYAQTDSTVLITGESGTGKELLAQSLHNASARQQAPFVAINCAAFPESLLESELFGYEEGAFTGSRKGGKIGLIEMAHTGTLFLDEIGDMPVSLQTRLLRVLQEREVLRLGASEPTPVDMRVIAATHCDLRTRIADGRFREDLFYRLNILRLVVPPLRERVQDIPLLVSAILERLPRAPDSPHPAPGAFRHLMPYLLRHRWPGNIRELENIVERAAISSCELDGDPDDSLATLFPELFEDEQAALPTPSAPAPDDLRSLGKAAEAAHARQVLGACQGDMDEAARRLGVSRSTLWRRLRINPLDPDRARMAGV